MGGPIQVRRKTYHEAYPADFQTIWYSRLDNKVPVSFLRHRNDRADDFTVVGDVIDASPPLRQQPCFGWTFAPDPSCPWSLARPVDFTWILNDAGSGNSQDVAYWWPVAPPDYVALGLCFTPGPKPEAQDYWCVHKNFCVPSQKVQAWSDADQGWKHHNGDVFWIAARGDDPNSIRQSAFLSAQALDNGIGAPMAMSAPGLNPPPPPPPPPPPDNPGVRPTRR